MSDSLTVLTAGVRLAKCWAANGTVTPSANAKHFDSRTVSVDSLESLSRELTKLEAQSKSAVVRGTYKPDALQQSALFAPADYTPGKFLRRVDLMDDAPHHFLMLDVDGYRVDGINATAEPERAIDKFIADCLPACFKGVSYHWQLSGSAGHPSKPHDGLNAHVWFWLDTARTSAQLKLWAENNSTSVDRSLFHPIQLHFTAAPIFEAGTVDPIAQRSGLARKPSDVVNLTITADEEAATAGIRSTPRPDPVVDLLHSKGMVKGLRTDGALNIVCPREAHHSGESGESASVYYPRNTGGYTVGNFSCLHAHCRDASRDDFLKALGHQDETNDDGGKRKPKQAAVLVAFVLERFELFHAPDKDVFARDLQTFEVSALYSRQLRERIAADFYTSTGQTVGEQSFKEALSALSGLGRFQGETHDVSLRFAGSDGCYELDLAQPGSSLAVRLTPGKWEVIQAAERFYRPESLLPLPTPLKAGDSLEGLWAVANIPESQRLLAITWLIECLRPDTPFPVCELLGEQGSGKSGTQEALRRMLDPNSCNLRSAPKTVEDIYVSGGVCAIISYENISHLHGTMQDALCVIATGGGFSTRTLYSNRDETIISVKRPVILNGIAVSVTAQDLVDRCITFDLPLITNRIASNELWTAFERELPKLLGALLNIAAKALAILPTIEIPAERRPRLLEFARLGMAVSVALGSAPDRFLDQFESSRQEALARTIDSSPVAAAVVDMIAAGSYGVTASAKEILSTLAAYRPHGCEAWPRSPKGLGDALRRAAPALRQVGIDCVCRGKGSGGVVRWSISGRDEGPRPASARASEFEKLGEATL